MDILQAFRIGVRKTNQSKRVIFFAWLLNVLVALAVVLPLLSRLDASIGPTVMEERLLSEMDQNWFQTFKLNNMDNDLVRHLDYTIFGAGPILIHAESYLSGEVIKSVGRFLLDLVLRFQIGFEHLDPLSILAVFYLLVSTFLAAGFVSMYSKDYRVSFQEFLVGGAQYFGRFFRLSLLSLVLYLLLFNVIVDPWSSAIPRWTANERSEMVPFVHYLVKNGAAAVLLGFLILCFDYAKIRLVLEDRMSALFALWAGMRFVFRNFFAATGLFLMVTGIAGILLVLLTVVAGAVHVSGYWSILLLFLLHQLTLAGRLWAKALFYASQTHLSRKRLGLEGLTALL